jgi:hypothetical protein
MTKRFCITALLLVVTAVSATAQLIPRLGQSRSGTSGFQFVKIGVDPRSAAMGFSAAADITDGAASYWNPALASQAKGSQAFASTTNYFVDTKLNYLSYIHRYHQYAIGASLQYLDSGTMMETTEFNQFGTGRTFSTAHISAGLTLSQQLTNYFSYGATVRYLMERIEEVSLATVAVDLGFFYRVGDTGLRFVVGVNNFGGDAMPSGSTIRIGLPDSLRPDGIVKESNFQRVTVPTTFILGAAYDVLKTKDLNWLATAQLTNPSDNSERLAIGSEWRFVDRFMLRAGYTFGITEGNLPSFGAGIIQPLGGKRTVGFDYAFSHLERLGNTHRIALKFSL